MFCRSCGYNLAGLSAPVCPECGRAFSARDPRSYTTDFRRLRRERRTLIAIVVIAIPLSLWALAGAPYFIASAAFDRVHLAAQNPGARRPQLDRRSAAIWIDVVTINHIPRSWRPASIPGDAQIVRYQTTTPGSAFYWIYAADGTPLMGIPTYE